MNQKTTIDVSGLTGAPTIISNETNEGTTTTILTKSGTIVVHAPRICHKL